MTLVVLACASVDWSRWRPALHGALALVLSLPVVGLLGLLMLAGGDEVPLPADPDPATGVGLLLAAVGNWGYAVLALGAFAPAGYAVQGSATGGFEEVTPVSSYERLGHWTAFEPGLWAAVAVTAAVLVLGAAVATRHSRTGHLAADLGRWLVVLAVLLPALGRLTGLRGAGESAGQAWGRPGASEFSGTLGVAVVESAALLLLAAALAGLLVAAVRLRARRRRG